MARAQTLLATLATAAILASFPATPVNAQTPDASRVASGFEATPADCEALKSAVWVDVEGKGACIRYYLSTAGGEGPKALVYLSGDAPSTVRWGAGRIALEVEPAYEAPSTEQIDDFATGMSKKAKGPALYLARIGLDGSSGWHAHRRTYYEVQVTTRALDLIKARHKLDGFHFAGQSGGGHLIGALLANRSDIGCAVPGSGLLMTDEQQLPPDRIPLAVSKIYNPTSQVLKIARQSTTRILVLTDAADQVVPVEKQIGFVRRLNALGGKAKHIFVRAFDDEHHQLRRYALEAAYGCIAGKSDEDIELSMFQMTAKLMAEKLGRDAERGVAPVSRAPGTGGTPGAGR